MEIQAINFYCVFKACPVGIVDGVKSSLLRGFEGGSYFREPSTEHAVMSCE